MDNKEDLAFEKYCHRLGGKLSFSPLYPIYLAQRRFPPKKLNSVNLPSFYHLEVVTNRASYNGPTQAAPAVVRPHCYTGSVGPAGDITPVTELSSSSLSLSSEDPSLDTSPLPSSDEEDSKDEGERTNKLLSESMIHPTYIRNPRTQESLDDSGIADPSCDEIDWVIVKK